MMLVLLLELLSVTHTLEITHDPSKHLSKVAGTLDTGSDGCLLPNTGFSSGSSTQATATSPAHCQAQCQVRKAGCLAFSYLARFKTCLLYSSHGPLSEEAVTGRFGAVSAEMACFTDTRDTPCLERGKGFISGLLETRSGVGAVGGCKELCKARKDCQGWTYLAVTRQCLLYGPDRGDLGITELAGEQGGISTDNLCLIEKIEQEGLETGGDSKLPKLRATGGGKRDGCRRKGKRIIGDSLDVYPSHSHVECKSLCEVLIEGCKAFTFDSGLRKCYFYGAGYGVEKASENSSAAEMRCYLIGLAKSDESFLSSSRSPGGCKDEVGGKICAQFQADGACSDVRVQAECARSCGICATCTDILPDLCKEWKSQNLCHLNTARDSCKLTCGNCGTEDYADEENRSENKESSSENSAILLSSEAKGCQDMKPVLCAEWKANNHCGVPVAKEVCPFSCGNCNVLQTILATVPDVDKLKAEKANKVIKVEVGEGNSEAGKKETRVTCEDYSDHCAKWALAGYCEQQLAKDACPLTCRVCKPEQAVSEGEDLLQIHSGSATKDEGCEDTFHSCFVFESYDFCRRKQYRKKMLEKCKKTCGLCDAKENEEEENDKSDPKKKSDETEKCVDTTSVCGYYKRKGYCSNERAISYLRKNCRESCGFCAATPHVKLSARQDWRVAEESDHKRVN